MVYLFLIQAPLIMPTVITLAIVAMLSGHSAQQPAGTLSDHQHPVFTDTAYSQLALTAEQFRSIRRSERKYAKKLRALGPASKQTVEALHAERIAAVKRILTPDQYRRWRQLSPSELPYSEMPMLPASLLVMPVIDTAVEGKSHMMRLQEDESPPAR